MATFIAQSKKMIKHIIQIQTIGPEGHKLLFVLAIVLVLVIVFFIVKKKISFTLPSWNSNIIVTLDKNKIYHPTVVTLSITNNSDKAIDIQHTVLRFKKARAKKAYKITSLKSKEIYPLYLEPNKTHSLPVTLQPFYDHYKRLKRYNRLRAEFQFDGSKTKCSRYVLLKSTIFRKEK